jgi:hypothetical protein
VGYSNPFCTSFKEYNQFELHWISDNSGPYDYTNNSDCKWLIAPQSEEFDSILSIKLWFSSFDLADDDTLFIFDGMYESFPLLIALSGNQIPDTIESSNNKILFNFKTNETNTDKGWVAHYVSNLPVYCKDTLNYTNNSVIFDDGSGDKNYMNFSECFWEIEPENAQSLSFSFSKFDIETGYDRLYFYDNSESEPELLAMFTGHEIPAPFTLSTKKVLIRFSTDESIIGEGWELTYEVVAPGIDEINSTSLYSIFPNPATDILNIYSNTEKSFSYEIVDIADRIIFKEKLNKNNTAVDISELKNGIYILKLRNKDEFHTMKFIKK